MNTCSPQKNFQACLSAGNHAMFYNMAWPISGHHMNEAFGFYNDYI